MHITSFNFALGDDNYETEINVSSHSPSSSLLNMTSLHKEAYPFSQNHKKEKIKISKADDIFSEIDLEPKTLLKIDVQGFEQKMLLGAKNILPVVDIIIIEINYKELYTNQPSFSDIYDFLTEYNFEFKGNWHQTIDPMDGLIFYSDSVFIKRT